LSSGAEKKTMKKTILLSYAGAALFVLGSVLAAPAAALAQDEEVSQPKFRVGFYWEGFKIADKNLANFFGNFQNNLPGIEASYHIAYNIDVWTTFRVFTDETLTPIDQHVDKFRSTMTSLGAIYRPVRLSVFEPFIGAGAELYFYSEKIEGAEDLSATSGSALGVHFQLGSYIDITKFLSAKLYARLNSVNATLAEATPDGSTKLKLGGSEFGLALLARF